MKAYYEEAGIQIFHGDAHDVLPTLAPVDLVLTDPPFGHGVASQPTKWQRRAGQMPEWWDEQPIEGLADLIKIGRIQIVWGGNYYPLPVSRGWLSWFKPDAPPSMANFEMAWTNMDRNARQISHSISATNAERLGHKTQKPLRVMKWSIQQAGLAPNSAILDMFAGTGTTAAAAKELGHRCILIEIEERYCEIAARRLSQNVFDFEVTP